METERRERGEGEKRIKERGRATCWLAAQSEGCMAGEIRTKVDLL
jgi:hypothetical protein